MKSLLIYTFCFFLFLLLVFAILVVISMIKATIQVIINKKK